MLPHLSRYSTFLDFVFVASQIPNFLPAHWWWFENYSWVLKKINSPAGIYCMFEMLISKLFNNGLTDPIWQMTQHIWKKWRSICEWVFSQSWIRCFPPVVNHCFPHQLLSLVISVLKIKYSETWSTYIFENLFHWLVWLTVCALQIQWKVAGCMWLIF